MLSGVIGMQDEVLEYTKFRERYSNGFYLLRLGLWKHWDYYTCTGELAKLTVKFSKLNVQGKLVTVVRHIVHGYKSGIRAFRSGRYEKYAIRRFKIIPPVALVLAIPRNIGYEVYCTILRFLREVVE